MTNIIPIHNNYIDLVEKDQPSNKGVQENNGNEAAPPLEMQENMENSPLQGSGMDFSLPNPLIPPSILTNKVTKRQNESNKDTKNKVLTQCSHVP